MRMSEYPCTPWPQRHSQGTLLQEVLYQNAVLCCMLRRGRKCSIPPQQPPPTSPPKRGGGVHTPQRPRAHDPSGQQRHCVQSPPHAAATAPLRHKHTRCRQGRHHTPLPTTRSNTTVPKEVARRACRRSSSGLPIEAAAAAAVGPVKGSGACLAVPRCGVGVVRSWGVARLSRPSRGGYPLSLWAIAAAFVSASPAAAAIAGPRCRRDDGGALTLAATPA